MALTSAEIGCVEAVLQHFEHALKDKPNLEGIYDPSWRAGVRNRLLRADCGQHVRYPVAMKPEIFDMCYPDGFAGELRQRLEEGAEVLLPRLTVPDRNHLIERLRGQGCWSAQEELLLARGFAAGFGADAVVAPSAPSATPRPEFSVHVMDTVIPVEAKGLFDSDEVRRLNEEVMQQGGGGWVSFNPQIGDAGRLRAAIAKKLIEGESPTVLVLTQYTPLPSPGDSVPLIRDMALSPDRFDISQAKHPLALGFMYYPFMLCAWFNNGVLTRLGLDEGVRERLRCAVRESFWPRADGVFFDERMDDAQFNAMMARMLER